MASLSSKIIKTTAVSLVKQATSAQDYGFSGVSSDGTFEYIGIADGHGKSVNAIYPTLILKKTDWSSYLMRLNHFKEIIEKCAVIETNGVGSTLSICKIYPDRFEFSWVGDSTGKLYKNGVCVFKTRDHDRNNEEENKRLSENPNVTIQSLRADGKQIMDIEIMNHTTVRYIESKLYNFGPYNKINFTHSLGHAGATGDHFSTKIIPRELNESYKAICATDGLWAMVCEEDHEFIGSSDTSCEDIVKFADKRWRQEWDFDNGVSIAKGARFPDNNIDDIGVSTWTC